MIEDTPADLAAAMRSALVILLDRLDEDQHRRVVSPFTGDLHRAWTYLPGQRPGLRLGDLSDEQLEAALDLLQVVHSVRGWADACRRRWEARFDALGEHLDRMKQAEEREG